MSGGAKVNRYRVFVSSLMIYLVVAAVLCAGCDRKSPEKTVPSVIGTAGEPAYGDALLVASIGEPSVLIPMLAGDSASHDIAGLVFNGLVKYDTDLKVIGDLAESWEISPDGLIITFHLKKGVKWTDGAEFTAEDVMFGYKTIIDAKTPTAYAEDFCRSKGRGPDRYTFRVTYEKPFAPALLPGEV